MIPVWPASIRQTPRRSDWVCGPLRGRVSFQPEFGPPVERRAVTSETMACAGTFPQFRAADLAVFRAFFTDDLAGGVLPFAWRDPETQEAWSWKIVGDEHEYSVTARGADLYDVGLQMLRLPGPPWWQPYCTATGDLRLPYVVADYANGVFGVDLARVPAASVAAVTGTYDVYTTTTLGVTTASLSEVVSVGEIPASAPVGVAKIVAYAP